MNAAVESYPPRASEEAVGAAEDAGTLNPLQLLGTAARLFGHVPTVTRAGTKLAGELARVAVGRSEIEAERRDWRFQDPTWTGNPGYHRLMQGYLAASEALGELAEQADLPDWRQRERARFLVTMLTSALAPTNTLLGNPAALKVALETGGGSLVAGARNFVSDLRHNGGLPSQVDRSQFVVGKDVAVTPGAVVFRNEVLEVLQYGPQTADRAPDPGRGGAAADQQVLLHGPLTGPVADRIRVAAGPAVLRDLLAEPAQGAAGLGPGHLRPRDHQRTGRRAGDHRIRSGPPVRAVRRRDHHGHRAEPPDRGRRRPGAQRQLRGDPAGLVGARCRPG